MHVYNHTFTCTKSATYSASLVKSNFGNFCIDREFVTSAKKFANFNEFSEIKKIVKIR